MPIPRNLTDAQALKARKEYATGQWSIRILADFYETSLRSMFMLLHGKTYQDVGGPIVKIRTPQPLKFVKVSKKKGKKK